MRSRFLERSALVGAAAVMVAGLLASDASARALQTGTLVVRVVSDPAPAGVSWTYSGAGPSFELGQSGNERTITLNGGTYQLREASAQSGQASTLTALSCSDPTGDTTTSISTASVSVGLGDGETVTCTFTHRALGRRSAAATLTLARTYAPVLRLSSGEPYRPLRLEDYVAASSLHAGSPPRGAMLQIHPTLFSLPTVPGQYYLDVAGAEPNRGASAYPRIEQTLEATRPRSTVYWHVARRPAAGQIAIEYWFLYLYNDFYDKHEADWEGITVILDGAGPLGVSYSAHQGRRWSPWASQTTTGTTHPVVYIAYGSHANYPAPGRYSVRVCWTLYGRHCTASPKVDTATGTGSILDPARYDLQEYGGAPYAGSWGSGTTILGIGRTKDQITDLRRRSDYSNPFTILTS